MKIQEGYKKATDEFVRKIVETYGDRVEKIILFGSYARGDYDEESDIDVLVVGRVSLDELVDVSFPIFLKYGVYISPHDMTPEHYHFLLKEGSGFIKNIRKDGEEVYA